MKKPTKSRKQRNDTARRNSAEANATQLGDRNRAAPRGKATEAPASARRPRGRTAGTARRNAAEANATELRQSNRATTAKRRPTPSRRGADDAAENADALRRSNARTRRTAAGGRHSRNAAKAKENADTLRRSSEAVERSGGRTGRRPTRRSR